jgi:hypothetical protein
MIQKRKSSLASRTNALQIVELDGLCCDDNVRAILCTYSATIDVTSVTSVDNISIGGTVVNFASAAATGTEAGRALLVEHIKTALHSLGYTTDGIELSLDGDNLTITTAYSQVAFDFIQAGGNAFTKVDCKAVGPLNVSACITDVTYKESTAEAGYFEIKPVAANKITNVVVNDGSGDVFDGPLVFTDEAVAGNAVSSDGIVYLSISGLSLTGATTFTVTITAQGCDDAEETFSYTFA